MFESAVLSCQVTLVVLVPSRETRQPSHLPSVVRACHAPASLVAGAYAGTSPVLGSPSVSSIVILVTAQAVGAASRRATKSDINTNRCRRRDACVCIRETESFDREASTTCESKREGRKASLTEYTGAFKCSTGGAVPDWVWYATTFSLARREDVEAPKSIGKRGEM